MHTSSAIIGLFAAFRRPQFVLEVIFKDFLPWVLLEEPKRILRSYLEYAKAFGEILSILFLLRTLVSPWKGIAEEMPSVMRWDLFLQAFFVNLVTRGIGMVIRIIAIVFSLIVQILLLVVFVILFAGWFLLPVLAVAVISLAFILL